MRYKDENKIKALHQAVIDVIMNEGFHNLSVAKIAKQAGVSSATLYIYYKDKKAMLGQVYLEIKAIFDAKLYANFDPDNDDAKGQFETLLNNYANALNLYPEKAMVMGVFNDNPDLIPDDVYQQGMELAQPVKDFYANSLRLQTMRNVSPEILISHTFTPINNIAEIRFRDGKPLSKDDIQTLIEMAWEACKSKKLN